MTTLTRETLPAIWASALINNDWSGLSQTESAALQAWLSAHPAYGSCLSCNDHEHIATFDGLITMCIDYVFPYQP